MAKSIPSIDTIAIHGGRHGDPTTGAVLTPICQSTTYAQNSLGAEVPFTYSRADNPTVAALEEALGALEEAPQALAFSSGMAAITTLCLGLLKAGDHVIIGDPVYGGTVRLASTVLTPLGVDVSFVDAAEPAAVGSALKPNTRLVLLESPANPTLRLADIAGTAQICQTANVPLAVDNTFLTAVGQQPLELGAQVSVYSTTKYIEGHNATIGGALVMRDEELRGKLHTVRKTLGNIQAPWDAWLTLRGLTTLPLRLERHSRNAALVARWLQEQPGVSLVRHPDLPLFSQRDLARRQQRLGGGLVAFSLTGGLEAGRRLLGGVKLCTLAENLGAAETLITHPASMTHADVPVEQRREAGISDGLIRLSVGLEEPADIIADLAAALRKIEEVCHA